MYKIEKLNQLTTEQLNPIAEKLAIPNQEQLTKQELIYKILDQQALTDRKITKNNNLNSTKTSKEEANNKTHTHASPPNNTEKTKNIIPENNKAVSLEKLNGNGKK